MRRKCRLIGTGRSGRSRSAASVQNAPVTVLPVTFAAAPNTTLIANCSVGMARCSRARDVVREGHVRRHAVESLRRLAALRTMFTPAVMHLRDSPGRAGSRRWSGGSLVVSWPGGSRDVGR
jgi:hypothetical protein